MAIGPEKLKENFMIEVVHLEHYLDNQLSTKTISSDGKISITCPEEMTPAHFEIIKERYLSAGWKDVSKRTLLGVSWIIFHQ